MGESPVGGDRSTPAPTVVTPGVGGAGGVASVKPIGLAWMGRPATFSGMSALLANVSKLGLEDRADLVESLQRTVGNRAVSAGVARLRWGEAARPKSADGRAWPGALDGRAGISLDSAPRVDRPRLARQSFTPIPAARLEAAALERIAATVRTLDPSAWALVAHPLSGRYEPVTGMSLPDPATVLLRCRIGRFSHIPPDSHINGHTTRVAPRAGGRHAYDIDVGLRQDLGVRGAAPGGAALPSGPARLGEALIAERLVEELNHARVFIEADTGTAGSGGDAGARLARLRIAAAGMSAQGPYAQLVEDYARVLALAGSHTPTWAAALDSLLNEKAVADHVNSVSRLGARPNSDIAQEVRGNLAVAMGLRGGGSDYGALLGSLTRFLDALDHAAPSQRPAGGHGASGSGASSASTPPGAPRAAH